MRFGFPAALLMLAHIQRLIVFMLLTAQIAATCVSVLSMKPWIAILVPALAVMGYAIVLAIEFRIVRRSYSIHDPARPSGTQLTKAWTGELLAAPRAFLWRQPFREHSIAQLVVGDVFQRRGIVFVHGFFCNRAIWNPWLRELNEDGVPFVAVSLEPVFGSIDDYRATIDAAVATLRKSTSCPPVVVAHSMGGLAVRAWLASHGDSDAIHRLVTIASPHAGTRMARRGFVRNVNEMRIGSAWLSSLESKETPATRARWICFWSHCDNIVIPTRSATLEGADNRHLPATAHVQMALHPEVIATVRQLLV